MSLSLWLETLGVFYLAVWNFGSKTANFELLVFLVRDGLTSMSLFVNSQFVGFL